MWVAVSNLNGIEYFVAATVQAEKAVKFTIRFIKYITESMRISFEGKQYNITLLITSNIKISILKLKLWRLISMARIELEGMQEIYR